MTYLQIDDHIRALVKRSSRRRTIGIKVQRASVQVNAPVAAPLEEIQAFVQQKSSWIQRHLNRQIQEQAALQLPQYNEGDVFYYQGQRLTIRLCPLGRTERMENELLLPQLNGGRDDRALAVANWLIEQAGIDLPERVQKWARRMGLAPRNIKIRHYKSRWGSCDRKGGLQFNWVIMMAPEDIIDYVVVHELAHLVWFDHSPRFWTLVSQYVPDYLQRRRWLRDQQCLVWQLEQ